MKPPQRGRITHRDQLLRNQASMDLYAALAGKPRHIIDIPPAPVKRERREPSAVPLEKDVQKTIIDGLRAHPLVGLVERVNSGQATETDAHGQTRYIQFHHVYSVRGVRFRAPDIHCTLQGGKRFVIEVKRPGWREPRGERELGQQAYIHLVIALGGFGLFATSWDQVAIELERIQRCLSSPAQRAAVNGHP